MLCDNDQLGEYLFKELIVSDSYRIRQFIKAGVDTIIDIGANVGMFSIMARVLYPLAHIIAIEPCQATYDMLVKNVKHFNIETVKAALGNGSIVQLSEHGNSGKNMFIPTNGTHTEMIQSTPLEVFASKYLKNSKRFILKIDCEGGEACMLYSKAATKVIKKSFFTTMEVHFSLDGVKNSKFSKLPPASSYIKWTEKFNQTHQIYTKMNSCAGTGLVRIKEIQK
jgi:FkbM family methyltransferase